MYRLPDGNFQRKTALIRLLEISEVVPAKEYPTSSTKRKAKIIGEISIDLAQHVGLGETQQAYPFLSHLAPQNTSVETLLEVREIVEAAGQPSGHRREHSTLERSRELLTTYKGGLYNS